MLHWLPMHTLCASLLLSLPQGVQLCRQWMKTVLQPLNEKAKDIIVNHSDLLEAHSVEPLLLQLVAHVSAYKVILSRYSLLATPACRVCKL